jgi:hypothetical protein
MASKPRALALNPQVNIIQDYNITHFKVFPFFPPSKHTKPPQTAVQIQIFSHPKITTLHCFITPTFDLPLASIPGNVLPPNLSLHTFSKLIFRTPLVSSLLLFLAILTWLTSLVQGARGGKSVFAARRIFIKKSKGTKGECKLQAYAEE